MLITPEQLAEIKAIVEKHHAAFIANAISPEALSKEVLQQLQEKGLVDVQVEGIKDAYLYGQVLGILESAQAAKMSHAEFKAYLQKNPIPLTPAEHQAVQLAITQAGMYAQGLGARVATSVLGSVMAEDAKLRARTAATLRDATAMNIARRKSVRQLRSDLAHKTGDWSRDWSRIAITEKQNAMQRGTADYYRTTYGEDTLVAKRTMPDACPHCIRLHDGADGQPKIFRLSDLEANGTNVGRKAQGWLPTVGPIHPHCHPAGTMVLTAGGYEPIESFKPGDLVLTHKGRWQRVSHVWESAYTGIMVSVGLEGGRVVRATANHPFLTGRGWVSAESLNEQDDLIDLPVGSLLPTLPEDHPEQGPTAVGQDDGFASILFGFSRTGVPVTAIYLDGDLYVREGQINVGCVERVVGEGIEPSTFQPSMDLAFVGRGERTSAGLSFGAEFFERCPGSPAGLVRFLGKPPLLTIGESIHPKSVGLGLAAWREPGRGDPGDDGSPRYPQAMRYLLYRQQLVKVHLEDGGGVEFNPAVPVIPETWHVKGSPIKIVSVSMSYFSGNVYNLTVDRDHSFSAEGVVSHNCQCQLIRVPAGWGFNEEGQMVPGGKLGELQHMEKSSKRELRKSAQVMGYMEFQGLPIVIENAPGTVRKWEGLDGNGGQTRMEVIYGYIRRTSGLDDDELDVFVGGDHSASHAYVIDQQDPYTGRHDEQKVMLGFPTKDAAEQCYRRHYDSDEFALYTSAMTLDHFKRWIAESDPESVGNADVSERIRLIVPLNKSTARRVPKEMATTDSPAGDRNVIGGYGANYITADIPERPRPPSLRNVGYETSMRDIAETVDRPEGERTPFRVDRKVYDVHESQRLVMPLPETPGAEQNALAREGAEERKRAHREEGRRRLMRPKNKIDEGEDAEDED